MNKLPADYHIHTFLCKHAEGQPEAYLQHAFECGLDEIGLSDHCPWPEGFDQESRMYVSEYAQYREIVKKLQNNELGITVRYGLEIDWVPGRMNEVLPNLENEKFDYLIGSIHHTGEFPFDHPATIPVWNSPGMPDKVWNEYAEQLYDMVSHASINIIGHIDLPKKFAIYPPSLDNFMDKMSIILKKAAERGIAMEINSSGLRKPAREVYPSMGILKLAKEKGVKICFGSDAHGPSQVAADFTTSIALAKEAGYKNYLRFANRKPLDYPLPD